MGNLRKIEKRKKFEERRKTNNGILPIVGNVVKLVGVGDALVQASENGHLRFVVRTFEGARAYDIRRDSIKPRGDGIFEYGHPPLITDYSVSQGRIYGILDKSLRSKKL